MCIADFHVAANMDTGSLTWIGKIEVLNNHPDRNVKGANMGPIWGRQDPGGPHVGAMNFATWTG